MQSLIWRLSGVDRKMIDGHFELLRIGRHILAIGSQSDLDGDRRTHMMADPSENIRQEHAQIQRLRIEFLLSRRRLQSGGKFGHPLAPSRTWTRARSTCGGASRQRFTWVVRFSRPPRMDVKAPFSS